MGHWIMGCEFAELNAAQGRIGHRFHARDLHLVLTPALRQPACTRCGKADSTNSFGRLETFTIAPLKLNS
jgi:hypothetical protein